MGAVLDQANIAFDDYNTHGVSGSGVKRPLKTDVREMARIIDAGRFWSITDFAGVVGDANEAGTSGTDCTAGIDSAIDSGESLIIPQGKFLFDADAAVMVADGQKIFGAGRQKSFLICPSSTGRAWKGQGARWCEMGGFTLKFADAVARSAGQKTLSLESCDNWSLHHIQLRYGLVNLDIESCIDMGFDVFNILAGGIAIRIAATLSTYGYATNVLKFHRIASESHTQNMVRVDQSGSQNVSAISLIDCRTEEDGTVSSGLAIIDLNGMTNNGASYGARIEGLHAEGLKQKLLNFSGPSGCTNAYRTLTVRDSTLIVPGASAYTIAQIATVDNARVVVEGVNAAGAGATHSFVFGPYTYGECTATKKNIFNTTCTKDVSSGVDIT